MEGHFSKQSKFRLYILYMITLFTNLSFFQASGFSGL